MVLISADVGSDAVVRMVVLEGRRVELLFWILA